MYKRQISWSGICSYGGLAIGAPMGVWIEKAWGLYGVGLVSVAASIVGLLAAWPIPEVAAPKVPLVMVAERFVRISTMELSLIHIWW